MLELYNWNIDEIEQRIRFLWPEKKVCSEVNHYKAKRYVYVESVSPDINTDTGFYYIDGDLEFYLHDKKLYKYLKQNLKHCTELRFVQYKMSCRYQKPIDTIEQLLTGLSFLINNVDNAIAEYFKQNKVSSSCQKRNGIAPPQILAVKDLNFTKYVIPAYQRPYKWNAKNVNQLINDLIKFKNKKHYRLGTLVLHTENDKDNIVDGQQRIMTISLLLRCLFDEFKPIEGDRVYNDIVDVFHKTKFDNKYTLHNISENLKTIKNRMPELGNDILEFILNKCEFVVIHLDDISEAFQFFDSQNARGKDLEPEDLLKAYHLRSIRKKTEADLDNIQKWEDMDYDRNDRRHNLFVNLYYAKKWKQLVKVDGFTKNDVSAFKGVDVVRDINSCYPFYRLELIGHIYVEIFNKDPHNKLFDESLEYPFNLNDQIINGSRFFDMVRHYWDLNDKILSLSSESDSKQVRDIYYTLNNYISRNRIGDTYVRKLFDVTMLCYIDKFGFNELDKVAVKIFLWSYYIRLTKPAVSMKVINNYVTKRTDDNVLLKIYDASSPYDIINVLQMSISVTDAQENISGCDDIIELYKNFGKTY